MDAGFPMFEEETRRFLAESAAASAYRPVKKLHAAVTIGSRTRRGGEVVTASTGIEVLVGEQRLCVACVGDLVRYPDGSESTITTGAGVAVCYRGRPIAVVGSDLANGDVITESLQASYQITHNVSEPVIAGVL
ncbi:MAG: PAAR domain-containing protein [Pseudomonadota bacterium]